MCTRVIKRFLCHHVSRHTRLPQLWYSISDTWFVRELKLKFHAGFPHNCNFNIIVQIFNQLETCPIVRISEFCPCYLATTTPYWTHHTSFTTPPVGGGLFSTTYFCDDLKIQSLPVAITTPTKPYQSTELTKWLQIDAFAPILGWRSFVQEDPSLWELSSQQEYTVGCESTDHRIGDPSTWSCGHNYAWKHAWRHN